MQISKETVCFCPQRPPRTLCSPSVTDRRVSVIPWTTPLVLSNLKCSGGFKPPPPYTPLQYSSPSQIVLCSLQDASSCVCPLVVWVHCLSSSGSLSPSRSSPAPNDLPHPVAFLCDCEGGLHSIYALPCSVSLESILRATSDHDPSLAAKGTVCSLLNHSTRSQAEAVHTFNSALGRQRLVGLCKFDTN